MIVSTKTLSMPSTPPLPAFYDSLDASLNEAWRLLADGLTDRRAAFHAPVVASIDLHGHPTARTMILRGADRGHRTLTFHSDIRSAKIAELRARPNVCAIAYDAMQKIQLRISGSTTLHLDDEIANSAWASSRAMSRLTYSVDDAPGSVIGIPTTLPAPKLEMVNDADNDADSDAAKEELDLVANLGRKNFCVVIEHIASIEWVYLASQGNRRALFSWVGSEALEAAWLQP